LINKQGIRRYLRGALPDKTRVGLNVLEDLEMMAREYCEGKIANPGHGKTVR